MPDRTASSSRHLRWVARVVRGANRRPPGVASGPLPRAAPRRRIDDAAAPLAPDRLHLASTSTAVIKRFGVTVRSPSADGPASSSTRRSGHIPPRYRGDFAADAARARARASDGAGALPEEPIRPASEEFERWRAARVEHARRIAKCPRVDEGDRRAMGVTIAAAPLPARRVRPARVASPPSRRRRGAARASLRHGASANDRRGEKKD